MIQKCTKCNNKFSYKDLSKATFTLSASQNIVCTNCNDKYRISTISMLLFIFLIAMPFLLNFLLNNSATYFKIIYLLFVILLYPFLIRLTKIN